MWSWWGGGWGVRKSITLPAWLVFSFHFYYSILWRNWSFSGAGVRWEYLEEIPDKEKKINRQADTYLWVGPWEWQEERLEKKLLLSIGGCIRQKSRDATMEIQLCTLEDVIDWQSQIASEAKLTVITWCKTSLKPIKLLFWEIINLYPESVCHSLKSYKND